MISGSYKTAIDNSLDHPADRLVETTDWAFNGGNFNNRKPGRSERTRTRRSDPNSP